MALKGFPRIRGDVPAAGYGGAVRYMFSPHTRGCSWLMESPKAAQLVFPAYAGMFHRAHARRGKTRRFPRIRGDVPGGEIKPNGGTKFSPHTRGCSVISTIGVSSVSVFPAYAGMFLWVKIHSSSGFCFPRIRGDVPKECMPRFEKIWFSPHTRGCSAKINSGAKTEKVFPAYAGMFLVGWR